MENIKISEQEKIVCVCGQVMDVFCCSAICPACEKRIKISQTGDPLMTTKQTVKIHAQPWDSTEGHRMETPKQTATERSDKTTAGSFTPGPWESHIQDNTDVHITSEFVRGKQGSSVADLIATVSCGLNETQKANARLIACAPELLEALKELRSVLAQNHAKVGNSAGFAYKMYRAEEAIRKAAGKE